MKMDAADHMREGGAEAFRARVDQDIGKTGNGRDHGAIDHLIAVYDKWLTLEDHTPIYAVLGTIAANLLPGDPVWLGLVAPPSSAKTEMLNSTSLLPYVVQAATLTPAGLLSGVPKRQQHASAKGGLLRQIDKFGILVLKDFGSILSMRPEAKAEVLAALREIYDGHWTRHVGTEGGRTLHWSGKLGLLFGCTPVIDDHYSVISEMGDRFLLKRLKPTKDQFDQALKHVGAATKQMRDELADAVSRLFKNPLSEPQTLSLDEKKRINDVISLVVRLRGAIRRDRVSREIEIVYGAEGIGRLGLTLERLLAGLDTIGVDRKTGLDVIEDIAKDSVPPLRRQAYEWLDDGGRAGAETPDIATALGLPTNTVRRALEDLAAYGLLRREKIGKADTWFRREWENE